MEGTQASTDIIIKLYDTCSMLKGLESVAGMAVKSQFEADGRSRYPGFC